MLLNLEFKVLTMRNPAQHQYLRKKKKKKKKLKKKKKFFFFSIFFFFLFFLDFFSLKSWKRESGNSGDHKLWKGSPVTHRKFKALHWNHHLNPYKNSKLKSAPSEPPKSAPSAPPGVGTFLHIPQIISNWVPCYRILIKQPCFQHE